MRNVFLIALSLAALLCATTVHAQTPAPATPSTTTTTSSNKKELRLLDCPLGATALGDCNVESYATRLGVYAASGVVMALALLFCCPIYCGGKYCCNCCGGRDNTPNYCCPNTELPARYSSGDLLRPKIVLIIFTVVAVGAIAYGYTGGIVLRDGLFQMGDAINGAPVTLQNIIDDLESKLTVQRYDPQTDTFASENLFAGTTLATEAQNIRKHLQDQIDTHLGLYSTIVERGAIALFAVFIIPAGIMSLSVIFSCCSCRKFAPMCMMWLMFIAGTILWFSHAMFAGGALLMGDACVEIHAATHGQEHILTAVLDCSPNQFSAFLSEFGTTERSTTTDACTAMSNLCYDSSRTAQQNAAIGSAYQCDASFQSVNCATVTIVTLLNAAENLLVIHPNIEALSNAQSDGYTCSNGVAAGACTVQQCADNCVSGGSISNLGKISKTSYNALSIASSVSGAAKTVGAQYASCDAIFSILLEPFDPPCDPIAKGLVFARQASGMEGLVVLISLFCIAWGAKRNMSLSRAGEPIDPNVDSDEDNGGDGAADEGPPDHQKVQSH